MRSLNNKRTNKERTTKGIVIIEPLRISVANAGQHIMSQTMDISSVRNSRHQTNKDTKSRDKLIISILMKWLIAICMFPISEQLLSSLFRNNISACLYLVVPVLFPCFLV